MNDIGTICAGCGKPRVEGDAAEHRPCLRRNLETLWRPPPTPPVSRSLRRPNRERYHAGPWRLRAWPGGASGGLLDVEHLFNLARAARWRGAPWGCVWDYEAARDALNATRAAE